MVALSLAELPGNTEHLVLAMGGLDNKVHLYCGKRMGKVCDFSYVSHIMLLSLPNPYFPLHVTTHFPTWTVHGLEDQTRHQVCSALDEQVPILPLQPNDDQFKQYFLMVPN